MGKEVKLGDGVANDLKEKLNHEFSSTGKLLIQIIFEKLREKVQDIDFDELAAKITKDDEEDILSLWSSRLVEEGLLPSGYNGLSNDLVIRNLHQEGYLDGLYSGYVLTMLSLADNNAPRELIDSTRKDLLSKQVGLRYSGRDELVARFKDEKYGWIENPTKEDSR